MTKHADVYRAQIQSVTAEGRKRNSSFGSLYEKKSHKLLLDAAMMKKSDQGNLYEATVMKACVLQHTGEIITLVLL